MPRRKIISDEAVLDAALEVMFKHGPAEFTLADVSAKIGIAPATLLQRFGDKRRLVVAAVARDNAAFVRMLDRLPAAQGPAAVIAVFRLITPDVDDADRFADQLLWLHQDMRDPDLNALARARFTHLRAAVAARMPRLHLPADKAAHLIEAQWNGALIQWGVTREGRLVDYVTQALANWFALARKG
jgi:AcrR family transcriptional regulator